MTPAVPSVRGTSAPIHRRDDAETANTSARRSLPAADRAGHRVRKSELARRAGGVWLRRGRRRRVLAGSAAYVLRQRLDAGKGLPPFSVYSQDADGLGE